ncbi:MAG: bifunctional (p)ppGpp synthetase/guanosine-3',5'-bis(diphosphate) 3'-pyrophosphohydrolase [Proteobacteria bacterium]|jgi:GTP pyrophosphokinase|nr:bifunctional (p)ppGpp synthetase/guanosine-3',5'-bis(diphosphate) 3'-pyrophosphohydrolase [Pseudomonadota bacterium]
MSPWRKALLASLIAGGLGNFCQTLRPLSDRLGLASCYPLEETAFRLLDPATHATLSTAYSPEEKLQYLVANAKTLLETAGISGEVTGRIKSPYSTFRKMHLKGLEQDEVFDRVGLRVKVDSQEECYAVLDLLHNHFEPLPDTFDDYIDNPKPNGYQSLHIAVWDEDSPIEFQIRTHQMHHEAEFGGAAHWRYKLAV